jgi:hypothetical protein
VSPISYRLKTPIKQDLLWDERCAKIDDTKLRQVEVFVKYPIKAQSMLQQWNASLEKYRTHAVDIRGVQSFNGTTKILIGSNL